MADNDNKMGPAEAGKKGGETAAKNQGKGQFSEEQLDQE